VVLEEGYDLVPRKGALGEVLGDAALAGALGQVEIEAKYAGYVEREREMARRLHELEDKGIPGSFDFGGIVELRKEARQALEKYRPQTLGQASRLEGITPSDLTVLMVRLRGRGKA
jgi:tRNA uridine 5-carboxymethylaminomethyl modification enzyme